MLKGYGVRIYNCDVKQKRKTKMPRQKIGSFGQYGWETLT